MPEINIDKREKPFAGLKIYYSGTIAGAPESDQEFPIKLVEYMEENGANVLSKHVAYTSDRKLMDEIKAEKMGITVEELRSMSIADSVRKQDLTWVDEATHVVALVNAPSHGVGMELQEAILKPRLGLNETPVLCLVHQDVYKKLSGMITGVSPDEAPNFYIRQYGNAEGAKETIHDFLTGKLR